MSNESGQANSHHSLDSARWPVHKRAIVSMAATVPQDTPSLLRSINRSSSYSRPSIRQKPQASQSSPKPRDRVGSDYFASSSSTR